MAAYISHRYAVFRRIEIFCSPGYLRGLKRDTSYTTLLKGKFNDPPDLIIIYSLLKGYNQCGGQMEPVKMFQCLQAYIRKILSSQAGQCSWFERVELKVYLEIGHVCSQLFSKAGIVGDTDSIRVHHQVADRFSFRNIQYGKEIRVNSRLTTTDLHDIRLTFVAYDDIQHLFYLFNGPVTTIMRTTHSITGWTSKVASISDLYYCQATMLLMILAKPAIIRTAIMRFGIKMQRRLGRLIIISYVFVIFDIRGNKHFFKSMF